MKLVNKTNILTPGRSSRRIALAATFTADPMIPTIAGWGRLFEIPFDVEPEPYAQVIQPLLDLIRHDRPYDEAVREMLTAVGDTTVRPAGNFWHPAMDFMLRTFSVSKATPTVARLFLGKRIECAE